VDLPTNEANAACYELLRKVAPDLWETFQRRLVPVAAGEGDPAERIRELMRLEQEVWTDFVEHDTEGRSRPLGRSFACCVDDLVGATGAAAIPAIASSGEPVARRREQLEALLAVLRDERAPSLATLTANLEIQQAIHELD